MRKNIIYIELKKILCFKGGNNSQQMSKKTKTRKL